MLQLQEILEGKKVKYVSFPDQKSSTSVLENMEEPQGLSGVDSDLSKS